MIKDKFIQDNLYNTAESSGVTEEDVEEVIDCLYEFIRGRINELDCKDMNLGTFINAKKNFNIPGLGKLYASEKKFKKINKIE